jgi:hypothetical protein
MTRFRHWLLLGPVLPLAAGGAQPALAAALGPGLGPGAPPDPSWVVGAPPAGHPEPAWAGWRTAAPETLPARAAVAP